MPKRTILLVEPWMTGSHAAWATGLQLHSRHEVEVLGGLRQGWRATIDHSAAQMAARVSSQPDLVLASSMVDLTTFREESSLAATTPALVYFHENQLTYDRAKPDLERGAVAWRSIESADRVAFNSRFHLDDFFDAAVSLGVGSSEAEKLRTEATVLPVGIDPPPPGRRGGPPTVLWNHRWEHDKDPDGFVAALYEAADLTFELILLGEGRSADRYRHEIQAHLGDRVVHAGFAPTPQYRALLGRADLVISTARQEFFGVSVAEAMAAGAVPLVPNRLAYPELLGTDLAGCLYEPGTLASRLRSAIGEPGELARLRPAAMAAGARFAWDLVAPRYDDLIDSMV